VARTVTEAFDVLLSRIPLSEAVTEKARRHRDAIEACLRANFVVNKFMAVGSFGHGTNIPRFSDIDYFMVTPEDELSSNSPRALREVKSVLAQRFWATDVRVSSPAVLVPFGSSSSEHFEITPAFADDEEKGVFWIPDGVKDWMLAAPKAHNAYTNEVNDRLNKRAKRLIRLLKLWNGLSGARLRSIYLELRVAKGLQEVDQINFAFELTSAFRQIYRTGLAAMQDPIGLTGLIPSQGQVRPTTLQLATRRGTTGGERTLQWVSRVRLRRSPGPPHTGRGPPEFRGPTPPSETRTADVQQGFARGGTEASASATPPSIWGDAALPRLSAWAVELLSSGSAVSGLHSRWECRVPAAPCPRSHRPLFSAIHLNLRRLLRSRQSPFRANLFTRCEILSPSGSFARLNHGGVVSGGGWR